MSHEDFIKYPKTQHIQDAIEQHTDTTGLMEGLYLKIEDEHVVKRRYKLIRPELIQKIVDGHEIFAMKPVLQQPFTEQFSIVKKSSCILEFVPVIVYILYSFC